MASVKSKHTGPEVAVRSLLHRYGYRYRLHPKHLPGSPDIAFIARRKAIMVHGCFWHGHNCRWGRLPKSHIRYWGEKIRANRARDEKKRKELVAMGWRTLVVWQCELRAPSRLLSRLVRFLDRN
jgi:DNA mismatch endonuclease (patch repair protein)